MRKLFILGLFALLSGTAYSQKCEKVLLSGKVIDTLRPQNFYNLMVVNRSIGKGFFGMPNGGYSMYVNDGDSITFSIKGYNSIQYSVKADANCQAKNSWYIEMKPQQLEEVVVYPLKSLQEIQEERAGLAMRETRQVTGIEVLRSPITALYQAFSQKEKNKRLVASYEYADKQKAILQELLRLYVAYDIFYLSEAEFDAFISFLNINEDFLKTATEMELVTFIKDKFYHFQLLKQR
jgi:hypothetical protein